MAKVYDALRRAEQERRKLGDEPAPAVARLDWEPEVSVPAPTKRKEPREGFFRRFWPKKPAATETGDINKRRVALLQPDSFVAEQFRGLRGRIDALESEERPLNTIAIASAMPGEGKTTASINLALVTALSLGRKVLLVDCDLRRPSIHRALGIRPEAGLAEVLTGEATLEEAIQRADGANLDVLPVRSKPANPSELLGSPAMAELIPELARRYDRVILDTPAALGLPDAKTISDQCDGLVIVVRADMTPQEDVQTVLELFDRDRLLGVVLNGTASQEGRYGYTS